MKYKIIKISKDGQPGMNRAEARNYLCRQSDADYYVFLDSDGYTSHNYFHTLKELMEKNYDIIFGPENVKRAKYTTPRRSLVFDGQNINVPSCNVIYRSDVFRRLGGFDESFKTAEDIDLNYRAVKSGCVIHYHPGLIFMHYGPQNFRSFLRQSFWYGYGWAQFEAKHKIKLNKPKIREITGLMVFRCVFSAFGYIYGKSRQSLGF